LTLTGSKLALLLRPLVVIAFKFEHIKITEQGYEITFTTGSFGTDQLICS
jgi:hypothetical protein